MASGIEAGKAYVKFLLDDKEFQKSLKSIGTRMRTIGTIGAAATGPIIAGFGACLNQFTETGDALADMSARTGISAGALSELGYAARQSGSDLGAVESAVAKMQKNIGAAAEGTGTFAKRLSDMGLSIEEIARLTPEQQFTKIADAVSKIEDPTLRAAAAQRAFGGAGRSLLPLLSEGADGMARMRDEAEKTAASMSTEQAQAAARLADKIGSLRDTVKALAEQIGAALGADFERFLDWASETTISINRWVKENPELIRQIAQMTAVIGGLSTAMIGIGGAIALATPAVKGFGSALKGVGTGLRFIGSSPVLLGIGAVAELFYEVAIAAETANEAIAAAGRGLGALGLSAPRIDLSSAIRSSAAVPPGAGSGPVGKPYVVANESKYERDNAGNLRRIRDLLERGGGIMTGPG